jgi:hypothetical protein
MECGDSSVWSDVCEVWQRGVDAVCAHLAHQSGRACHTPKHQQQHQAQHQAQQHQAQQQQQRGSAPALPPTARATAPAAAAAAAAASTLDLVALLHFKVAPLLRKPVRLRFVLQRLLLGLDARAALDAARDFWERAAREAAEQAKG